MLCTILAKHPKPEGIEKRGKAGVPGYGFQLRPSTYLQTTVIRLVHFMYILLTTVVAYSN